MVRRIPLHPLSWEVDDPTPVTVRTTPEFVPDVVRWLMAPYSQTEHDGVVDMSYTVTSIERMEEIKARILSNIAHLEKAAD